MDFARPDANRVAGRPTAETGATFTGSNGTFAKAEFFVRDRLGIRGDPGYRGAHHPSATGYRRDP